MTDINDPAQRRRQTEFRSPVAEVRERLEDADRDGLIACVELLFFAYRDFTGKADEVLAQYGFGRAHHRVLHFVYRHPGLRVAELLEILRITKQSLARVLRDLIDEGFVQQREGAEDRRERRLYVTPKGGRLAEKLMSLQVEHVETALQKAGLDAGPTARRFLFAMISEEDRAKVERLTRFDAADVVTPSST